MKKRKDYTFNIIVIGSGGTGTYFLKEFSRYLSGNRKVLKIIQSLTIIDGDVVEKKNLGRQAFAPEDIGNYKASVMASILNDAFDLDDTQWCGFPVYLTKTEQFSDFIKMKSSIPVIIGCVDNHACRLVCEKYFKSCSNCIYYDSANEFSSGEIVFAPKFNRHRLSPLRSEIFPEIKKGDLRNVEEMSCTELNEAAPQHIAVNMNAGMYLLSAVTTLFETGTCFAGMTVFDVLTMESQHFRPDELRWKKGKKNEQKTE